MAIYLTGSLAYDRIMNFAGLFSNSILPESLDNLSVSFFIHNLTERYGGVGGNVAYSLSLLEEKPLIVASAGKDFDQYSAYLTQKGLPTEGISIFDDQLTASAYIFTDEKNNQITAFHAAALAYPSTYTFPHLNKASDIAHIGATNPQDMEQHVKLFQKQGVPYIFDPSQQLPVLSDDYLREAINGAYLVMGNKYEISLMAKRLNVSIDDMVAQCQRGVIMTHGENGSTIFEKGEDPTSIQAVKVSAVKDPTGAGDSYRSGVIKGLLANKPLSQCCALGATCAAYCVEQNGSQEHSFTMEEFISRYEATFGVGSFPL